MTGSGKIVKQLYGNKVRVRVCGLCKRNYEILLIKHEGLGKDGILWSPPGGGMDFGFSAEENLEREFLEETGLIIKVENFLFINEFLSDSLHAIELFFSVKDLGGALKTGIDPEMGGFNQIIKEVKFMNWSKINELKTTQKHNIFSNCSSLSDIFNLKGYFKFENNYIK
ncbi:hypothetical protein BH23BAC1_BH23BAC1_39380 [soil metagenome]